MWGAVGRGAASLRECAVALMVGIVVGSYSSLFLAAALVSTLKEREKRWRLIGDKVRGRLAGDGADGSTTRTRIIERSDAVAADTRAASSRAPGGGPAKRRPTMTAPTGGGVPPRPRKKKR